MFSRPTNPVSHRLARLAFFLACVAALIVAALRPGASLSRRRPRPRADRLPLRLLCRRRRDRAGARDHRADAAGRAAARLRGGAAGAGDRRRRGLVAGAVAACRRGRRRASTTSRPTPPIRRPWSSPSRCARAPPIRRPIRATSAAALQRDGLSRHRADHARSSPPAEAFKRVDRVAMAHGLGRRRARAGGGPPRGGRHHRLVRLPATTSWCASGAEGTTGSRIDIRSKSRARRRPTSAPTRGASGRSPSGCGGAMISSPSGEPAEGRKFLSVRRLPAR